MSRAFCVLMFLLATAAAEAQQSAAPLISSPSQKPNGQSSVPSLSEIPVKPIVIFGNTIEIQEFDVERIEVAGAITAISNDSAVVEGAIDHDTLTIFGKAPGVADILVITPDGVRSIGVTVTHRPPVFPPGFVPPIVAQPESETGSYELRLDSDPRQVQNRADFTLVRPDRTTQFHLITANFVQDVPGSGQTVLPSAFYRITTPTWNVDVLDETVNNSPLTVNQVTLRGFHFGIGPWTFHAGYTALATFSDFFIPTARETAFGIGYSEPISPNSKLTENFYYYPTPSQSLSTNHSGPVGSVVYQLQRPRGLQLLAELGISHGVGGAAQFSYRDSRDSLQGFFQQKPRDFASLSIGNIPGTQYQLTWNRNVRSDLVSNLNVYGNHLLLPGTEQKNASAVENLQYRFAPRWTFTTGGSYADISQSSASSSYSLHTLTLPEQINFDIPRFGVGLQYQLSHTSQSFALGQLARGTVRVTSGGLQVSGYAERQTQAFSVVSVFSEIPSLEEELQRLGITITDPQQLMNLLQDSAFLQTLGFPIGATLNLVPVRLQYGANLTWTSSKPRPQRLTLDFIRTTDQLFQGSVRSLVQSGSYSCPLGRTNDFYLSASWFQYSGLNKHYAPIAELGLRHNFSSLPAFFDPIRHGAVSGVVFIDETRKGSYLSSMPPLEGVEVVLDGSERTRTDRAGRYFFANVAEGRHVIEVRFHSARPFWFTTPSTVNAEIDSTVNFGITYAPSKLIGVLKNDAGVGVPDVDVKITGPEQQLRARSDGDGRLELPNLVPGEYTLAIDPETVPPGYVLDELVPVKVRIDAGLPQHAELRLQAVRTLTGEASYFEPRSGAYLPLRNEVVTLTEISRQVLTDDSGKFVFQDLPAGNYTVIISGNYGSLSRTIFIPTGPADLREDLRVPYLTRVAGGN